jgi:hypothetical protein
MIFRPLDDHGHSQSIVIAPVNASWLQAAIVTEENDDGIVLQAIGTELSEHFAKAQVHPGDGVQVSRPLLPHHGMIWVVGWRGDVFRCRMLHMDVLAHPLHAILLGTFAVVDVVFVFFGIHDGEEGLSRLQRAPVLRVLIVNGAFVDEVEVQLSGADTFAIGGLNIGREKARIA